MVVLTDDQPNPTSLPTRANIIRACHWLVEGARPNDSLFLHFSGHGGQTEDLDGDEEDGLDETIYPVDFKRAGMIVDDELHDILVKPLPAGCRLTAIFDCCHSGSVLDLPYEYVITQFEVDLIFRASMDVRKNQILFTKPQKVSSTRGSHTPVATSRI